MPRWGACWMSCDLARLAADAESIKGNDAWARRLFDLDCRIDHHGTVESEDPIWFRACVRLLLHQLLLNEPELIESAAEWGKQYGPVDGQTIVAAIRETLVLAESLAVRDGYAVWTSGDSVTQTWLREYIRRAQLPIDAPDRLDWPHIKEARAEARSALTMSRKALVNHLQLGSLSKDLRQAIHTMHDD